MTVLTDFALGLCSARWGIALIRQGCAQRELSQALWGIGFLAAATAAILGGASHAVGAQSPATRRKLWRGMTLATGVTSASMLASTVIARTAPPQRNRLLLGILAKFLTYAAWMASRDRFLFVVVDYGTAMAGIAGLHGRSALRAGAAGSRYILGGVLVSLVAAAIQMRKLALHRHFNHNDLYHLVQIGACYLFYRGGRRLHDHREPIEKEAVSKVGGKS